VSIQVNGINMPHFAFRNGYFAGWCSIKGSEPIPNMPPCIIPPGEAPFRAGLSQGVRDALASATSTEEDAAAAIDQLLERAIRRSLK
jgi:hypothetical protein